MDSLYNGKLHEEWLAALPDVQTSVPFDLVEATAAVFRVGSHSHGTYVPPDDPTGVDDLDLMVVVVPPPEYVLGMKRFEHADYKHGKLDVVIYDWAKWLRMVVKSNPNVVGTLWLEPEDMFLPLRSWGGPLGSLVLSRERLLSKRMHPAFIGYARGQLHKMTHHAHQGYMGEKRKRIVEQYGYDVKNAAHLIRLLRMACEAFETRYLNVRRRLDANDLIDIKRGLWSKEQVIAEAEMLFARADKTIVDSTLRDEPDELLVQRAMVEGYKDWWDWREFS